jgi:hypothetical protein
MTDGTNPVIEPAWNTRADPPANPVIVERTKMTEREILRQFIQGVKDLAFRMPPPNGWTPQLIQMATTAEAMANRAQAALEAMPDEVGLRAENEAMKALLNTPEVDDFAKGAVLEAAHQRQRWGSSHDAGKTPFDWFWLVGYLAQKAAAAAVAGDNDKARHHTISTASALANWHLALSGTE